jgi:purine-nucleoside phosphorylase
MSQPYDERLRASAREVARRRGISLREGVYVAIPGPSLETRAEYRMAREMGGDVVGMSTVPEVIVAVHGGMRVLGISIITDYAVPETLKPVTLEEIIAAAGRAEPSLTALTRDVIAELPA